MFIQQSLEFSILFQLLCIARDLLLFAFDLKLLLLDVKRRFRLMISVHSKQMIPDTVKGDSICMTEKAAVLGSQTCSLVLDGPALQLRSADPPQ